MRRIFACVALLVWSSAALAGYNVDSSVTIPPGTSLGNPGYQADNPQPVPNTLWNVGHLAIFKAVSMQVTTDQTPAMVVLPAKYQVTSIYATNCTVAPTGDVGGIYTAISKGGTPVVAATQTYTALASATAIQALTVNVTTSLAAPQLYFSLTTGTTGGPCDIYVDGIGLQ